ncbi:MAG: hypothetical protein ABWJ97_03455 [Thermoproteus sp.]
MGVLYDVIGNVNSPYGLVKPVSLDNSTLGQALYVREVDLKRRGRA